MPQNLGLSSGWPLTISQGHEDISKRSSLGEIEAQTPNLDNNEISDGLSESNLLGLKKQQELMHMMQVQQFYLKKMLETQNSHEGQFYNGLEEKTDERNNDIGSSEVKFEKIMKTARQVSVTD